MQRTFPVAFLVAAVGGVWVPGGVRAQTCAANVPHVTGTWVVLPYQMPINPISASLLPTGKVLIVAPRRLHLLSNMPNGSSPVPHELYGSHPEN